jgi:hypothetical protein
VTALSVHGFVAPGWFLLLAVAAVLLVGYLIVQVLRRRHVMLFANLELLEATTAGQAPDVYDTLREQIGYETKRSDASRPWVILGTLTSIVAGGAALLIGQRLP